MNRQILLFPRLLQQRLALPALLVLLLFISACQTTDEIAPGTPTRSDNMLLGNPSLATPSTTNADDYLMQKAGYTLSYNRSKGTANWVSWHLSAAWKGATARQDDFRSDLALPVGWYAVKTSDYTNSGFDRGHLCPSDDRDSLVVENSETFLMTNMTPQAPNNNRITWKNLEEYCRSLMGEGNELYVMAGPTGIGGIGANGGSTKTIGGGKITVPESLWKIAVILPVGPDDANRISADTRVIAVLMPNRQDVSGKEWGDYRVSVDKLEEITGYNFLRNVPQAAEKKIEAKVDTGPTK